MRYIQKYASMLLLACTHLNIYAADAISVNPENSWQGENGAWYCDDGFRRAADNCIAIEMPANAFALGSEWYCQNGFVRYQEECVAKGKTESKHIGGSENPIPGSIAASKKLFINTNPPSNTTQTGTNTLTSPSVPSTINGCAENGSCYGDISSNTGRPKTVRVGGYYRSDGTYVRSHYRSRPN